MPLQSLPSINLSYAVYIKDQPVTQKSCAPKSSKGSTLDSLGALFQRVDFLSQGNLSASGRSVSQSKGPVNI